MKTHRQTVKFGVSTEKRSPVVSSKACALPPHQWKEVTPADLPTNLVLQNQAEASDCGAQGPKKAINLQTGGALIVSAHPLYARRSNNPEPGMSLDEILNNPCTYGTDLESQDPSDQMTEEQMNAAVTLPTPIRASLPEELDVTDIEMLASAYDAYGALVLTVNIAWDEWNSEQGVPAFIPGAEVCGGHCLGGGIPGIWNGTKGIYVQNSWGNDDDSIGGTSWVFLSEEFLQNRGTGAGTFKAPVWPESVAPEDFSRTLKEGMSGPDVAYLQSLLGLSDIDGKFGPHTLMAVVAFQVAHHLSPDGIVGPLTQAKLAAPKAPVTPTPTDYPKLDAWCVAAQSYEGWCENPPSRSFRNNNPGNLEFNGQPNAVMETTEPGVTPRFAHFANYADGYQALYGLFYNACSGSSHIYRPTMTLVDFYNVYAPSSDGNNSNAYATAMAEAIGVGLDVQIGTLITS